jgi:hypothetical protein
VGRSKRIGQLRRLIEAAGGEAIVLTPGQMELARELGYEVEEVPAARKFEPGVDVPAAASADLEWWAGDDRAPMPRLTRPLTLSEAHLRWRRAEVDGALVRGTGGEP